MSGHTEGPLVVSAVRGRMDGQAWLRVVEEASGIERAFVPFGDRTDADFIQCTSDAKLFAAAPDMLEALEALLKLHEAHHNNPEHARARAAISKATLTRNEGEVG